MKLRKDLEAAEDQYAFLEVMPPELREFIGRALESTGVATIRKRRLPAEQVVLLVIGLSFHRHLPLESVCDHLQIALPDGSGGPIAKSAIPAARERLGEEPLEWLFNATAKKWGYESAQRERWRDRTVFAVDGTALTTPDTPANREAFGGQGPYPTVRLVTLLAPRSRVVCAARFAGYEDKSEGRLAAELWEAIPDNSVTLIDRGFGANVYWAIQSGGQNRDWVTRGRQKHAWKVLRSLGKDDEIVEITVHEQTRNGHPDMPKKLQARAIRYRADDSSRESWLLTSLMEPVYSREELVALYHERWEIEISFDEIKNKLQEPGEPLRSKTPSGIRQEIWGLLLAYNVVRRHIEKLADRLGTTPREIGFKPALQALFLEMLYYIWVAPGKAQKHTAYFDGLAKRLLLPPRRAERRYPREVKRYARYPVRRRTAAHGNRHQSRTAAK